jgi:hypothetical protein
MGCSIDAFLSRIVFVRRSEMMQAGSFRAAKVPHRTLCSAAGQNSVLLDNINVLDKVQTPTRH